MKHLAKDCSGTDAFGLRTSDAQSGYRQSLRVGIKPGCNTSTPAHPSDAGRTRTEQDKRRERASKPDAREVRPSKQRGEGERAKRAAPETAVRAPVFKAELAVIADASTDCLLREIAFILVMEAPPSQRMAKGRWPSPANGG
ncbi:hypothetical protein FKP32DRAFT_1593654 [Trametes sanguinea]|nr:hypothetical protein FKP32DRAFT_1593654 [Trametes sanguinea]